MVKRILRRLRRWPSVEVRVTRLASRLRSWPAEDFGQFVSPSIGTGMAGGLLAIHIPDDTPRAAPRPAVAPATVEMLFVRLQIEGRFDEMWELVATEAQRAWGTRDAFVQEMSRLDDGTEVLDVQAVSVAMLEGWTDLAHGRTYSNVAQLGMRYRVRQQWREWTFDRLVHLVPAAGGWRTLCYPTRARTAAGR